MHCKYIFTAYFGVVKSSILAKFDQNGLVALADVFIDVVNEQTYTYPCFSKFKPWFALLKGLKVI